MHEWSLAEAVVETAIDIAKKNNFKTLSKIKIRRGELQQIEKDLFKYAIEEIISVHSDYMKDTQIEIEEEKVKLRCRVCGHIWEGDDILSQLGEEEKEAVHFIPEVSHTYANCPSCGSTDFEIVKGRGLYIDSITGDKS